MAGPVTVNAYTGDRSSSFTGRVLRGQGSRALPPISSFAFSDILRSADSADFQSAIDGIAEICAKNRMSLADEYASHLPPQGEITATSSATVKPQLLRPGMRRALTSVPEGSSGSSEGSRKSKKTMTGLFGFRRQQSQQAQPLRKIRIGSMGRTISVGGTTALAGAVELPHEREVPATQLNSDAAAQRRPQLAGRTPSNAAASLQRLLGYSSSVEAG